MLYKVQGRTSVAEEAWLLLNGEERARTDESLGTEFIRIEADRNSKGPFCTLDRVRYSSKRGHRGSRWQAGVRRRNRMSNLFFRKKMSKKETTSMMHEGKAGAQILFFGRSKCEASEKLLSQMNRNGFDVTYVESKHRVERLPENIQWWDGDYIVCFRSLSILPDSLLKKARIAAINFHPAPPEYPGSGSINFALYDEVDAYGVTAHLMNEKVDNGKILEVRRFPVRKGDNLLGVLERTHSELYHLCSDFVSALATVGESYVPVKIAECEGVSWGGEARLLKELEKLQTIDVGIEKSELERIIRATDIEGFPPKVMLHGYKFYLRLND